MLNGGYYSLSRFMNTIHMEHLMTGWKYYFIYAEYYVNVPTSYKSSKSSSTFLKSCISNTKIRYLPYTHKNKTPIYNAHVSVHKNTHTHTESITSCKVMNKTNIFTVELENIVDQILAQRNAQRHCIYLPVDT